MSAIVVTVTTPEPFETETYRDALAVVIIRPHGSANGLAVDAFPDTLFALTLREIADRLDPPPPTVGDLHTRQGEGT